jgi:malate dehydrogenase (oxaloacetate-decarboxylating)(NADP+)
LLTIGKEAGVSKIAGMYIIFTKRGPLFLADTTINFNPTAEELAEITLMVAKEVKLFNITPRIAMLSYSNFGSSNSPEANLVRKAREIVKTKEPSLICDGDVQGILAFNKEILKDNYPFTELLDGEVNTLIFPNLAAGNIAYNLLQEVGGADSIGPILLGLNKPVHVLQLGSSIRSIFNMVLIAVVDAQTKSDADAKEAIKNSKWWKGFQKTSHDI